MIKALRFSFIYILIAVACSKKSDPAPSTSLYFPPSGSSTWETVTPASLGWNESAIPDLQTYLVNSNTRAFIVLKDGKIVIEQYNGAQLNTSAAFTVSSSWYWASAGKTLTSALVGIANANGKINFDAKTSDYLGTGWTSLTSTQESKITVRHQLTMSTGLDDYNGGVTGDNDCTDPSCLIYKADPSTRWAYHTGPYTLLDGVIAAGTGQSLTNYLNDQILSKVGMDGSFQKTGYNNVFVSTPRSMARFGLLLLNKGVWNGTTIIPSSYFDLMTTSSQNLNPSYGYLTWLNGKNSYMTPGSQVSNNGPLTPNAPSDMFAAMGKNGQLINVVPSMNLVMIRMGDSPTNTGLVPFTVQNDIWAKLNAIITK
ncbi:MAG TPA: serine hydrolase domain-containing protein [Cyclobacteriaceae bacterium]|jgi:CubicO group peptidase (beta-lactamase class C family)|nr:serine hydrolase domain-containing protein [Cyclobacteriaceae bacterium]